MSDPAVRVRGFRWAGVRCGIKTRGADLMLLVSDRPASAAGVLTRNVVASAPVQVTRAHLRSGVARAIVANSGCSNVAMGAAGVRDASTMAALAGLALGIAPREVFVASTGVIGEPLPMAKIASASFRVGGARCSVAGIAKGSGMIEPNMATMLSFVATDAGVTTGVLRALWREIADETYNRVTVDGETSTSDTALVLANGAAGAKKISGTSGKDAAMLAGALLDVATELAKMLARDGEGATKLVTIDVTGAKNDAQAEAAGRRIANSLLVKTALFGGDPNWGRILQTVGAARASPCSSRRPRSCCAACRCSRPAPARAPRHAKPRVNACAARRSRSRSPSALGAAGRGSGPAISPTTTSR